MSICTAHKKTGEPCSKVARVGQNVCASHGGSSPQALAGAAARIEQARQAYLELLIPGLERLRGLIETSKDGQVLMRAVEHISDRTLGKVTDKLKLSGDAEDPLEIVITRARARTDDSSLDNTA